MTSPCPSDMTLPPVCFTQSLYSPAQSMMNALVPHTIGGAGEECFHEVGFSRPGYPDHADVRVGSLLERPVEWHVEYLCPAYVDGVRRVGHQHLFRRLGRPHEYVALARSTLSSSEMQPSHDNPRLSKPHSVTYSTACSSSCGVGGIMISHWKQRSISSPVSSPPAR